MEWKVYYHNINSNQIEIFDIFSISSINADIKRLLAKEKDKEQFNEKLQSYIAHCFQARTEWEIFIEQSIGQGKPMKTDVYKQLKLNWDRFVDYIWSFKLGG